MTTLDQYLAAVDHGIAQPLLESATPELYRRNAFRVLELPVEATMRDVSRREKRLAMAQKLGVGIDRNTMRLLPLSPPPDVEAIRGAKRRLADPMTRIVEDRFGCGPPELGGSDDGGLRLLSENRPTEALATWLKAESDGADHEATSHNLALLYHLVALDLEHKAATRRLTESKAETCATCWNRAYRRWQMLVQDESFWQRFADRLVALDDPRLTREAATTIRDSLPRALLMINARLAVRYAEMYVGAEDEQAAAAHCAAAKRHRDLMAKSGFDARLVQRTLKQALGHKRERVKMICDQVKSATMAEPDQADRLIRNLIRESQPQLRVLELLLEEGDPTRDGAMDEVASIARNCITVYANETEDWNTCVDLLETTLPLAASPSLRERIAEDLETVGRIRSASTCFFCEDNQAEESAQFDAPMYGNVNETYTGTGRNVSYSRISVPIPRCQECKARHDCIGTYSLYGAGIGLISGIIIYVGILWAQNPRLFSRPPEGDTLLGMVLGFFVVVASAGIMARIFGWIGEQTLPESLRPSLNQMDYLPIQKLLSEGWKLGKGP